MIIKEIKQNIDDRNIYTKRFRPIYIKEFNTLGFAPFTFYYYGKTFDCDGIAAGAKGDYQPKNDDILLLGKDNNSENKCKIYIFNKDSFDDMNFPYISETKEEKLALIGKVTDNIITLLNFNKEV